VRTSVAVVQPPSLGGFSVVNVKLKVSSLLSQCIRHFAVKCSGWTLLFSYWCLSCFGASPLVVVDDHIALNIVLCCKHTFYSPLLLAWRSLDGSFVVRLLLLSLPL